LVRTYNPGFLASPTCAGTPPYNCDWESNDFKISSANSPVVDSGVSTFSSGVTDDFIGTLRPQGDEYDMGAYEVLLGLSNTTSTVISNPGGAILKIVPGGAMIK